MKRITLVTSLAACFLTAFTPVTAAAQSSEVGWGASWVSRYVWRGVPYSAAAQIQPWVTWTRGSVELGAWGSYGVDGDYKEQNEWITVTRSLPKGSLAFTLVDYYFTDDYGDFFDGSGVEDGEATGPHALELSVEYTGPENAPVRLLLASTVYNDPEPSVYGAAAYDLEGAGLSWSAEVGYLFQDGGYYEVGGSGLINLRLSASRPLVSLGPLELFATGSVIRDAKLGDTYFVLELGF